MKPGNVMELVCRAGVEEPDPYPSFEICPKGIKSAASIVSDIQQKIIEKWNLQISVCEYDIEQLEEFLKFGELDSVLVVYEEPYESDYGGETSAAVELTFRRTYTKEEAELERQKIEEKRKKKADQAAKRALKKSENLSKKEAQERARLEKEYARLKALFEKPSPAFTAQVNKKE